MSFELFDEIKLEYNLCINEPDKYKRKVNSISDLMLLKEDKRLIDTDCPVFIVGNYETAPIVMFGINPGYSSKNNPTEYKEARISWERYLQLYKNFYNYFESNHFESPYYNALKYLISGLIKKDISKEQKWKIFDRYLINMELIPYHSTGITFPNFLSKTQLEYLLPRFQNSLNFIINYRPKLFIFNGSPWYILLIKNNIINKFDKVSLTKKFNLYFFVIQNVPCILFDKFFQRHFWGITNEDRQILDQIVIKFAVKFYALTEKYPNPKQYAEQVMLKKIRYDPNIAILYSISHVRTNPSDYLYKPGQLNEQVANDIRNTIIESYPTLASEDNNSSKDFLDPRDFRERVTKKLEEAGIFLHLEGKKEIRSLEHKTHRPGRKRSSDEANVDHGGKQSAYTLTEEVVKLKQTIKKPGAIEYVYEKITSSNLPHRFAKFILVVLLHIAKVDEVSLHKLMGIGEVLINDDLKQIDKSDLVNFQRFLCRFNDHQLEQIADNGAQLLIKEPNYHVLLFFLAGLLKV